MDAKTFAEELLKSLSEIELLTRVNVETEKPIVKGYAYTSSGDIFLRFYFNELTGTMAFALIKENRRIWGIDCDNQRGWHRHPEEQPENHVAIAPLAIAEIVRCLQHVLLKRITPLPDSGENT